MRIDRLQLTNFRCFDNSEIDLGADLIAIFGRNGVGKTALYDAIEFALFGRVARLARFGPHLHALRNVYSGKSEKTAVRINIGGEWIRSELDESCSTSRVLSSSGSSSYLDILYSQLVDPDYFPPRRRAESVEEMFRSTLFLSQDSIRRFVEGSASERVSVLATLAGSAHILRASEKAKAVIDEALRRQRRRKEELSKVSAGLSELNMKLEYQSARRDEILTGLTSGEPVAVDSLGASLSALSLPDAIPNDAEQLDLFAESVKARVEERRARIADRSALATRISVGWDSHLRRQSKLRELEKEKSDRIRELETAQATRTSLMADLTVAREGLEKTKHVVSELEYLSKLIHRKSELASTAEVYSQKLEKLQKDIRRASTRLREAEARFSVHETATSEAQAEYAELSRSVVRFGTQLDDLREFHSDVGRRESLEDRLSEIKVEQRDSEARLGLREQELSQKRNERSQIRHRRDTVQESLGRLRAIAEEKDAIIQQLLPFVSDETCPLCGTNHGSTEDLRHAIHATLESTSPQIRELMDALDKARTADEQLRSEEASLESSIDAIKARAAELGSEFEAATRRLQVLYERATQYKVEASVESVQKAIEVATEALRVATEKRDKALERANEAGQVLLKLKEEVDVSRGTLDSLEVQLRQAREDRADAETELESLNAAIKQDARGDEASAPEIESRKRLAQSSVAQQNLKLDDLERERAQIEVRLETASAQVASLEADISEILAAESDFEENCRALEVSSNATLSDISSIQSALSNELDALRSVAAHTQRYVLQSREALLEEEIAALRVEIDRENNRYSELGSELDALKLAEATAMNWNVTLGEQVNEGIRQTANRHQLRIERHFKSLIPSPHQFDHVALRFERDELSLGIQFRDSPGDAGEPKLYLSNAQANVLAIAIFLSLGASRHWAKLDTLLLDDPVQHLDDLDAVAFLDTLRATALGRFGARKQILVSTCDRNLYLMMLKKFRPLEAEGLSFRGISLVGQGHGQPQVIYDHGEPKRQVAQQS